MKAEVLYFDGCPTYGQVRQFLEELRKEEGWDFELQLVNVETDERAVKLKFTGSPTILVNGEELFPPNPDAPYARACRMFFWEGKMHGAPTKEMLRQALQEKLTECPDSSQQIR